VNVSSLVSQANLVGVEAGYYLGKFGVFVTTGTQVSFLNGTYLSNGNQQALVRVAGSATAGDSDGSFSSTSASFKSLGRMKYDSTSNTLFGTSDANNLIRILYFPTQQVYTVSDSSNNRYVFPSPSQYSNAGGRYPGMDIDLSGSYLYVTDRRNLYNLTRVSGSPNIFNYVRRQYTTLNQFMTVNSWPISSYIFGIAAVESQQMIYATVSYSINVIIRIPMSSSHYSDIVILAGDQSKVYGGLGDSTPYLLDGFGTAALLAFPSSLTFDPIGNALYFTEAFTEFDASIDGWNEGSLTVRRVDLGTGYVSKYVGYDYSQNRDENGFYVTSGGYRDGWGGVAQFSYPLTISYSSSRLGGPVLYVVDYFNTVIRTVYTAIGAVPTAVTHTPTSKPTPVPTFLPTVPPTLIPSRKPSTLPTPVPSTSPSCNPTFAPSLLPTINYRFVNVSSLVSQANLVGVEAGYYLGKFGVFVTTGTQVSFLNGTYLSNGNQQALVRVAGSATAGDSDGSFSSTSASFKSLGRMKYDSTSNTLFGTSDANNLIRILYFPTQQVYTVSDSSNNRYVFPSPSQYSNAGGRYPGMDIDLSGSYLYVTDRRNLYNLTRVSGSPNIFNYVRRQYTTLNQFMTVNSWPISSYIFGIAAVESQQMIYATVSYSINVIIRIPMSSSHYSDIVILAGDQSKVYGGLGDSTPYLLDGFGTAALLAFPSSLTFDPIGNALYFTEAFTEFDASIDGWNEGSLTVRRVDLGTGYVSKYVGYDYSQNRDENGFYVTSGGYRDGWGGVAQFSYPLTISYSSSRLGGPVLYVVDYFNTVIRTVYTAIGAVPTAVTHTPTSSPTILITPLPSSLPSPVPTNIHVLVSPQGSSGLHLPLDNSHMLSHLSLHFMESANQSQNVTALFQSMLSTCLVSRTYYPTISPSFVPTYEPEVPTPAPTTSSPTSLPSFKPSRKPSVKPSTCPSTFPTRSPTQTPTRRPTLQPSSPPTSFPTMVYNTTAFKEVSTFPYRDGCDDGYYDVYWDGSRMAGGSTPWSSFLSNRSVAFESDVLVRTSILFSGADCTNCPETRPFEAYFECSDQTALDIFFHGLSFQQNSSMSCEGVNWITESCWNGEFSFCVDCESPCSCSAYQTTFPSQPACHPLGGKASGLCLSIYSPSDAPGLSILNLSYSSESRDITVWIDIDNEGFYFCAALDTSIVVTDINQLMENAVGGYASTSGSHPLLLQNLLIDQDYNVYCYAQSVVLAEATTSLTQIMQSSQSIRTRGLKSIILSSGSTMTPTGSASEEFVFRLNGFPSNDLEVAVEVWYAPLTSFEACPQFANSTKSMTTEVVPSLFAFDSSSNLFVDSTFRILTEEEGCFYITLSLSGDGSTEFEVEYDSSLSSITSGALLIHSFSSKEGYLPSLRTARYSSLGTYILLQFDSATDRGQGTGFDSFPFSCSAMFEFEWSNHSVCNFLNDSAVRVVLPLFSTNATLIGSTLRLKPQLISAACFDKVSVCETYPKSNSSEVLISAPYQAVKPVVVISTPQFIPTCSNISLSYESSTGHAGQKWVQVAWVVKNLKGEIIDDLTDLMNDPVPGGCLGNCAQIPQNLLSPQSYLFLFSLTNIFGVSTTVSTTVRVQEGPLPRVMIDGAATRTITRSSSLTLLASIFPSCSAASSNSQYLFSWSISREGQRLTDLQNEARTKRQFSLSPYALASKSLYTITVQVIDTVLQVQSSSTVTVYVVDGSVIASIAGGDLFLISPNTSLSFDASSSIDNAAPSSTGSVSYSWSCLRLSPTLAIVPLSSQPAPLSILSISENFLEPSSKYLLRVSVVSQITKRYSTASVYLTTTAETPSTSMVKMEIIKGSRQISLGDELILSSELPSSDPFVASWFLQTALVATLNYTGGQTSVVPFPLRMNTATWTVDASFSLRLTLDPVHCLGCESFWTQITVKVNSGPICQEFQVSPTSGGELSTQFQLATLRCVDDDLPLSYSSSYMTSEGLQITFSYRSASPVSHSTLPAGLGASNALSILSTVSDTFDAWNTWTASVTVAPRLFQSAQELNSFLKQQINETILLDDFETLLLRAADSISFTTRFVTSDSTALSALLDSTQNTLQALSDSLTQFDDNDHAVMGSFVHLLSLACGNPVLSTTPNTALGYASSLTQFYLDSSSTSRSSDMSRELLDSLSTLMTFPNADKSSYIELARSILSDLPSLLLIGETLEIQSGSLAVLLEKGWPFQWHETMLMAPQTTIEAEKNWIPQSNFSTLLSAIDLSRCSSYLTLAAIGFSSIVPQCVVEDPLCFALADAGATEYTLQIETTEQLNLTYLASMTLSTTLYSTQSLPYQPTSYTSDDVHSESLLCTKSAENYSFFCDSNITHGPSHTLEIVCTGEALLIEAVCPLYNLLPLCVESNGQEGDKRLYKRLDWNSNSTTCSTPINASALSLTGSPSSRRLQVKTSSLNQYSFSASLSSLLGKEAYDASRLDTSSYPPTTLPTASPTAHDGSRNAAPGGLSNTDIYSIAFPIAFLCFVCVVFLLYNALKRRARHLLYARKAEVSLEDTFYTALSEARDFREEGQLELAEEKYLVATAILENNSHLFALDISTVDQAAAYYELGEVSSSLGEPLDALPAFNKAHGLFKDRISEFDPSQEKKAAPSFVAAAAPPPVTKTLASPTPQPEEGESLPQSSFQRSMSNLFPSSTLFPSSILFVDSGAEDSSSESSSSAYSFGNDSSADGVVSHSRIKIVDTLVLDDDDEKEEDDPDSSYKSSTSSSSGASHPSLDDFKFTSQYRPPSDSSDEDQNLLKIGSLHYHWNHRQQRETYQASLAHLPTIDGALEDEINRSFSKML
jgi:tetratricopeptide (TPR) repeat protein